MLPGQSRYYRLDLKPEVIKSGNVTHIRKEVHHWSPDRVFAQDDLYTTQWGRISNTEIEQFFFGALDRDGPAVLDSFTNFDCSKIDPDTFNKFMTYMSVQKLRTPRRIRPGSIDMPRNGKRHRLYQHQGRHR